MKNKTLEVCEFIAGSAIIFLYIFDRMTVKHFQSVAGHLLETILGRLDISMVRYIIRLSPR